MLGRTRPGSQEWQVYRPGWTYLESAGMVVRALRVARREISYFKYLFESYEGVAVVRTVETIDRETAIIALLATPDFAAEVEAILADVVRSGGPAAAPAPLPAVCREDWFLAAWASRRGEA